MIEEILKIRKLNRLLSTRSKRVQFWCVCDRNLVSLFGKGRRCMVCRRVFGKGRGGR